MKKSLAVILTFIFFILRNAALCSAANPYDPSPEGIFDFPIENTSAKITAGLDGAVPAEHTYSGHIGYDLEAKYGTPIFAIFDGTITYKIVAKILGDGKYHSYSYGNFLELQSDEKFDGKKYLMLVGHLSSFDVEHYDVPKDIDGIELVCDYGSDRSGGSPVKIYNSFHVNKGDLIGYSGSCGRSTGPHLHIELYSSTADTVARNSANRLNPDDYISNKRSAKRIGYEANKNFPDKVFSNFIFENFDTDQNNLLSQEEADNVTEMLIHYEGEEAIYSLKGIEIFKNLTVLSIPTNELTELDLSENINLESLDCSGNKITALDLSKNTKLKYLDCRNNALTSINFGDNDVLEKLYCQINYLTSLEINSDVLIDVNCENNYLEKLKIESPALLTFVCNDNDLTELDVSSNTDLQGLQCKNNCLTALDVSKNQNLRALVCSHNRLTALDLSSNTGLYVLYCDNNHLNMLDLSKNTALTEVSCHSQKLGGLKYTYDPNLTYRQGIWWTTYYGMYIVNLKDYLGENVSNIYQVTTYKYSFNRTEGLVMFTKYSEPKSLSYEYNTGLTKELRIHISEGQVQSSANRTAYLGVTYYVDTSVSSTGTKISVNKKNFAGGNFRNVARTYDENQDDFLSQGELDNVTYLRLEGGWDGIYTSLKGIEHFRNLKDLYCDSSNLTELDLSKNINLETLTCNNTKISKLDLSKNVNLKELTCQMNRNLTGLDLSKNINLETLTCNCTKLAKLDLSKNVNLKELICNNNSSLTELDLSKNVNLTTLKCCNNSSLTKLDLSKNINLTQLNCSYNNLTELDLSSNTALVSVDCCSNQLTKLNVSKNTTLTSLICYANQLTELDVSNSTKLITLNCGYGYAKWYYDSFRFYAYDDKGNNLKKLDLSKNVNLKYLYCNGNKLTELDLSKNIALIELHCAYNQIKNLDISKNTELGVLNCSNNKLSKLNLENNKINYNYIRFVSQTPELSYEQHEDGFYYFNLKNYLGNDISRVSFDFRGKDDTEFNSATGIIKSRNTYNDINYYYDTKSTSYLSSPNMPITLHAKDEPVIYTKYLPNAKIENCYNVSLQATGYPTWYAVITWSYEGELPDGLTFNNGSIYGEVKDSAVTKTFRVFASNDCGIDSRDITIKVVKNDMKIDFNFREASVTGGTAPYTWDYIYLPGGMSFTSSDSKLIIEGTPDHPEYYTPENYPEGYQIILKVTDANGEYCQKTVKLFFTKPEINGTLADKASIKQNYLSSLTVNGGTAPYAWTISEGTLPAGLNISADLEGKTLTLQGKPTTAKEYKFALNVTDKNGQTDSKNFSVAITKPIISGNLTAKGIVKKSYSSYLTIDGGAVPYVWTKSSGTLPAGLNISPNKTGTKLTLKGTPTTAKSYTFTLKATDKNGAAASKKFTLTVTKPIISGDLKTSGVIKKSYSSSLTISGGTSPYTWTKSSGTLPKGLELLPNKTGTKLTLKGTPTTAKSYTFTLKATDKNGAAASKKFTVTVTKPIISGDLKTSGVIKKSYSSSLTISDGTSPYTWTKSSGTLPKGLELLPNKTGTKLTLRGTPTTAKAYTFTLKATDKNGAAASKKFTVTISETSLTDKDKSEGTENIAEKIKDLSNNNFEIVDDVKIDSNSSNFNENYFITKLTVASEDILWQGEGRDEDLIGVQADKPLNFIIGEWIYADGTKAEVSELNIYIDEKLNEDVFISEEGLFTIPAEFVSGDFKIQATASADKNESEELKSEELYISVE